MIPLITRMIVTDRPDQLGYVDGYKTFNLSPERIYRESELPIEQRSAYRQGFKRGYRHSQQDAQEDRQENSPTKTGLSTMAMRTNSQDKSTETTTEQATKANHNTEPTADELVGSFADTIAWFFSRPAALYKWCTAPTGGQRIFLGSIAIYFWLCSAESYWQALAIGNYFSKTGKFDGSYIAETHPSFMPKPFSPNNGNIQNIGVAFADPNFYVTGIISIVVLGVQANLQRGKKSVAKAKQDYESVKNFRVGNVPKEAIDVVHIEAKAYKEAGTANHKKISGVVRGSYAVDLAAAIAPLYRFMFLSPGAFVTCAIWVYINTFMAEKFVGLWQANEDIVKAESNSKRFPKLLNFRKPFRNKSESA
jgi:hypothetical protein